MRAHKNLHSYNSYTFLLLKNKNLSKLNKFLLTFIYSHVILKLQKIICPTTFKFSGNRKDIRHMKDKLTIFTKYLLDIMFYAGIIVIATLPLSIKFYGRYNSYFADNYYSLCVIFFYPVFLPY